MSSTSLAVPDVQYWTDEQIALIKSMFAKDMSNDELQLLLYTAKRCGLDPLARQIYVVKRGGKLTIQTGIDGYRLIADRTGKLAGISDYEYIQDAEGQKYPSSARVTVKKLLPNDSIADFTATARWGEYNAGGPMWAKMPYLMLGKCAEALALRKAFPADLSGVYTAEEMAQADSEPQREAVVAEVERQKALPAAEPSDLDWMYQKSSGVLLCRVLDVALKSKRGGKGEFVAVKINQPIEGKDVAFYFHESRREELLVSKGHVCKFMVSMSADGKFLNIDEFLEHNGFRFTKPEGDPEVKARLLASNLGLSEGDLKVELTFACGDWAEVVDRLEARATQSEVTE
jgi:phage recombination protein Bet